MKNFFVYVPQCPLFFSPVVLCQKLNKNYIIQTDQFYLKVKNGFMVSKSMILYYIILSLFLSFSKYSPMLVVNCQNTTKLTIMQCMCIYSCCAHHSGSTVSHILFCIKQRERKINTTMNHASRNQPIDTILCKSG